MTGELCNDFKRPGFFKQMRGAWDDFESLFSLQCGTRLTIEGNDLYVLTADDQERRRLDSWQGVTRKIGPATAGYDGADDIRPITCCYKGCGGAGASAEQPNAKALHRDLPPYPIDRTG